MNVADDSTPSRGAKLRPTTMRPRINWSSAVEATGLQLDLERARTDAEAGRSDAAESGVNTILADINRQNSRYPHQTTLSSEGTYSRIVKVNICSGCSMRHGANQYSRCLACAIL